MNPIEMRSYYAIRLYRAPSNIGIVFLQDVVAFPSIAVTLKRTGHLRKRTRDFNLIIR